jgi:hypothetical protein
MIYQNLAPIFSAFINRMTLNDMHQLNRAVENSWHEQLNGNAGTQNSVQNQKDQLVKTIIGKMLQSDRDNLVKIIESLT